MTDPAGGTDPGAGDGGDSGEDGNRGAGEDRGDGADSGLDGVSGDGVTNGDGENSDAAAESGAVDDGSTFPCPECGDPLSQDARFCARCRTPVGEGGDAVDLSELDGLFDDGEGPEFPAVESGERRAAGRAMVVAGLAVAVPLAPLGLFLVSTVRPLTVWTAPLVFLGSWLAPAAYLARARVPAVAFARSLYLVAAATALIPVGLRLGDSGLADGDLEVAVGTVTAVALLVAGLAVALGRYVHGQAGVRGGESRSFERAREGPREGVGEE